MQHKYPKGVVTDGDGAMREAIKQVFPTATHRLCAWNLNKNAGDNVKSKAFVSGFTKAMLSNFTPEQFEDFWSELVKKHQVETHPWIVKTYDNKLLWASAYLRNKFFGRIRTTSQCEAINAIIKSYVRKKGSIFEFMHNYDEALIGYRNNELVADFKSNCTGAVLTSHLRSIESHADRIYTVEVFLEVKEQIIKAAALIVKEKHDLGDTLVYRLTKYCEVGFVREVACDVENKSFQCSCQLFDSRGIPCSHIIYVMKEGHIQQIPDSLILSRWTKDAKVGVLNLDSTGDVDCNLIEQARFGSYCSAFTSLCKEASSKNGIYGNLMEDIMKLQKKYCTPGDPCVGLKKSKVGDPVPVKTKGAPKKPKTGAKKQKHCQNCNSTTHPAMNCSVNASKPFDSKVILII